MNHEYLVTTQRNKANNPVLVSEPYMLPVGIETPAKKLADKIDISNQFQGYNTKYKQQSRVDNIKMGIIEEVLTKYPVKTNAIIANSPKVNLELW